MTTPSTYPESPPRAQARAMLTWVLGNDTCDVEERLAAGDALAALRDGVPAGMVLAPVAEMPGSLAEVRRLLEDAAGLETSVRGTIAVSLALRHLRRAAPPSP
ncbi:MAG TPA: hypothetical protein VI248_13430 [Kineosporiaceae bacterium]